MGQSSEGALAENERVAKTDSNPEKRAVALTWLFHLVDDLHQPLHTVQIFTTAYPNGDRGGNEICVRPSPTAKPITLHDFWDGVITSSRNLGRLRKDATELRNRAESARDNLPELTARGYESWAYESYEIARKIAYQNGTERGTSKRTRLNCGEVADAVVLTAGYVKVAGRISDRRIILSAYRLADLLKRITGE